MPQFILLCTDKPDSGDIRAAARPDHLAYIQSRKEQVPLAGPVLSPEGAMAGSMLILDVADLAEAQAFAAGDPYAKAGLFAATQILPWRCTIGPLSA